MDKQFNRMAQARALLAGLMMIALPALASAQPIGQQVKKILFLGNSITYQGNYVNDVEAYIIAHDTAKRYEILNLGLPSETVSGLSEQGHAAGEFPRPDLHERLSRVLEQIKPDLVLACYGMNDGIYLPFDESRFARFKAGIKWLHDSIAKTGVRIVHLTPPHFDELKGNSTGYEAVLARYSKWLLEQQAQQGWEIISIHQPMKDYLEAHRKVDEQFSIDGFALAEDGVHPGETGHWIMARQVLVYLGYKGAATEKGIAQSLKHLANGKELLQLVEKRQRLLRDAWLTATGHKRPGLAKGLPLEQAYQEADRIGLELQAVLKNMANTPKP